MLNVKELLSCPGNRDNAIHFMSLFIPLLFHYYPTIILLLFHYYSIIIPLYFRQ